MAISFIYMINMDPHVAKNLMITQFTLKIIFVTIATNMLLVAELRFFRNIFSFLNQTTPMLISKTYKNKADGKCMFSCICALVLTSFTDDAFHANVKNVCVGLGK